MTAPTYTALPTAPSRADATTFDSRADPWLTAIESLPGEVNGITTYIDNQKETFSGLKWWFTGTVVTSGKVYFDPTTGGSYRAKSDFTSLTIPSGDLSNWEPAGGLAASDADKLAFITATVPANVDELSGGDDFIANGAIAHGEVVFLEVAGTVKSISISAEADHWYGVAQSSVADGESVRVAAIGETGTGLSSLTIGSVYYVDDDGTLTISASGGRLIGYAKSTTELFITKGNAQ